MLLGKQSQRVSAGWPGLVLVVIATFILVSSPMLAPASQIHFDIDTLTAGTISWAGGNAPFVGTDIEVDQVMGLDTPNYSGVAYPLIDGELDFVTGKWQNYSEMGPIHRWTFAGGGSLTLTGGVDFGSDGTNIPAGTELMKDGEFSFNEVTWLDFYPGDEKWFITIASFTDYKNEDLLTHYGMPSVLYNGNFNISFEVQNTDPTDGFVSSRVLSGDISNYPVPIPAAVWLLGSGLIGLVGLRRRRVE